ncbi:MAG TPA: glutaredoxin family protein [Candidatus Sulfomarinibacteraceae bacterium]|nr:glutaredoxin family protein [Candidatus Sulfomarinibacteraceae bacterium]
MVSVIFLTRPGCHLCEEALPVARRVARLTHQDLAVVNIDGDDELVAEYGLRIPVVTTDDGRVLAEGRIGLGSLFKEAILRR